MRCGDDNELILKMMRMTTAQFSNAMTYGVKLLLAHV